MSKMGSKLVRNKSKIGYMLYILWTFKIVTNAYPMDIHKTFDGCYLDFVWTSHCPQTDGQWTYSGHPCAIWVPANSLRMFYFEILRMFTGYRWYVHKASKIRPEYVIIRRFICYLKD